MVCKWKMQTIIPRCKWCIQTLVRYQQLLSKNEICYLQLHYPTLNSISLRQNPNFKII